MAEKVRYLSDLELYGNMAFALPVTDFPQSAAIGTMILKGAALYCYLKLGDLETWFPFAKETNSYVHTQGVAAQTWTVNHNLGTASIWYQVRDENGAIQQVGKTDVSANTFTLNFTCPMLGTVVVVAPDSINVPEVKASSISIGSNVIIDSSGVRVNGNYVLTSANIATQIATAVASETDRAVTAETSLSTATAAVATSVTSERNRALTAESNLSTDISTHANDSSIHTTMAQVNSAIQDIVGAAPAALDTLKEIADQLANDESAVSALTTVVSGKATKATTLSGYGITDAYTTSEMDTSLALKTNDSSLASVAKSGSYTDLTNKPTIPVVPTNVSAFTNDSNYQTAANVTASLVNKADKGTTLASYGITDGLTLGNVVGTSNGTASAGTATTAARSDHVHPTDITREPAIIAGTTAQFFRGDKTWATMPNSSIVVNTTSVTGNTSAAIGYNYTLSFSATSALSGGSITSFTVTKPDNTTQTVSASSNAGSLVWVASGTSGQVKTFTVVANDNLGNSSASATFSTTLVNVAVNVPGITSPSANATGMLNTFTMSTGTFGLTPATGFTDTHQYTDWEIWTGANRSGTLVWSSINDATNRTTITVPNTAGLAVSTTYYIAVRHKGTTYGWGGYAYSTFTTASQFVPTVAGTAYEGGFYAGRIVISGLTYALVVSPKSSGNTTKQWKTTNNTTAGTLSLNDGLSNSNAMNTANHPAAQFCRGLTIASKSDWYLPSRDELEVCYRNLKPTTGSNTVYASRLTNWGVSAGTYNGVDAQGNGDNDYSVDASGAYNGAAYTASSPAQTAATAFQAGGTECFDTAWYWSSTEFNAADAWGQYFAYGDQYDDRKTNTYSVRAVRKVLI